MEERLEMDLCVFLDVIAEIAGVRRAPRRAPGNVEDLLADAGAAEACLQGL